MQTGYKMKTFHGNKSLAKKTIVDGITFDSKAEATFYEKLKYAEKLGFLKIISLQPKVYLSDAKILYKPDFLIEENKKQIWIDVKGFKTPVFALKLRLWKFYGPGVLRIVAGKKVEEVNLSSRNVL